MLPTDTVYGLGADAFSPDAVGALLAAKGRGRDMPVPVLVGSPRTLDGLATGLSARRPATWSRRSGRAALTVVATRRSRRCTGTSATPAAPSRSGCRCTRSRSSCSQRTGPMAVSSANRTGQPPATTTATRRSSSSASRSSVYLDGGPSGEPVPSTIVDVTGAGAAGAARGRGGRRGAARSVVPDLAIADRVAHELT